MPKLVTCVYEHVPNLPPLILHAPVSECQTTFTYTTFSPGQFSTSTLYEILFTYDTGTNSGVQ